MRERKIQSIFGPDTHLFNLRLAKEKERKLNHLNSI